MSLSSRPEVPSDTKRLADPFTVGITAVVGLAMAAVLAFGLARHPSAETPSGEVWNRERHTVEGQTVSCVVVRNGSRQQITAIDCEESP